MAEKASGKAESSKANSIKDVSDEVLENLYVTQKLSQREIGDRFNTSGSKVRTQLLSRGIIRVEQIKVSKERLERLYHNQGMSQKEIAEELGISKTSVYRHVNHYDLKKSPVEWQNDRYGKHIRTRTTTRGYEVISIPGGGNFPLHRLVAIAEHGVETVKDKDIHHKNGVKWDNRPENLEPLDKSAHTKLHKIKSHKNYLIKADDDEVESLLRESGYESAADEI